MAFLKIKKYNDPILKEKSDEVKEINLEIRNLILDMVETMIKSRGVGLAAPQIGELKRIIVIQTEKGPIIFINPKILKKGKKNEIIEEGCLCFPGLFLKIKRAKDIEVETLNERGEKINLKAEGLLARTLQHEIDHLDGILFIDRLPFWQKFKIKKKLKNL